MGARTWMLVYSDGDASKILRSNPSLDRQATVDLAKRLFSSEKLVPLEDGNLSYTSPDDDELIVGSFPGLAVVAAKEFAIDYPAKLDPRFLKQAPGKTVYLHAMYSVIDWFSYVVWQDGKLLRSLSLSPESGILVDVGPRLPFEVPYWAGEHPMLDGDDVFLEYPLPFHPLELGEAALRAFFGYQLEGFVDEELLDAATIPLMRFKRSKPWWRLW